MLGVEDELGSIQDGKYADMIVLDQNLFDGECGGVDTDDCGDTDKYRLEQKGASETLP